MNHPLLLLLSLTAIASAQRAQLPPLPTPMSVPNPGPATAAPYAPPPIMPTWQDRFIDWCRDLGFLQKSGVETKAATDVATFVGAAKR